MTISLGQSDAGNVPAGNILNKIQPHRCGDFDSTARGIPAISSLRFAPRTSRLLRRIP